ncbi:helix-turn-helix domain-containing protein [Clostridium bornimense]|uniref:helix-turn-helix domain-containing protein n=1 Tax=Clostridium bornimense TaxID=1216932 RepID=UPI00209E953E|nr:helix-turn-helix transcriptional regulator [Clostridium bornimense]
MTPFNYLKEYRVLQSNNYLSNSDESISNIAFKVGFNGISYYGKVFKEHMNCSPSQYRMNHKK